jgi:hypothetical protein
VDEAVHLVSMSPASAIDPIVTLPFVPVGTRLEPGGVYLDLARSGRGPFVALLGQIAGTGNRYVARRDLCCRQWRCLVKALADASVALNASPRLSRPADPVAEVRFAGAAALTAAP